MKGKKFKGVLVTSKNYNSLTKEERQFHQKALKAYLKGRSTFRHRYRWEKQEGIVRRVPAVYQTPVKNV